MPQPSLHQFRQIYYDRQLDYWDIADTFGVPRWQIDEWRRQFGLPSRHYYGTYCRPRDPDWQFPAGPVRRDYYAGRHRQSFLWDRRRLPGLGLLVRPAPRRPGDVVQWWMIV